MKWSDRQLAIFDAYENTRKNIAIEATAGSSKTTCIVECCRRTPPNKKVLFMAFNKSIAEELRERLPSHIDVNTFHSKGLRVLLSNFRIKPKINENKCFVIGKKILDTKDMDVKQQIRYLFEIQIIWNYIRVNLITDYEKKIPGICIEKNIEFQERMVEDMEKIRNAWHKEMKKINSVKEINIDFTDMLYFPYQLLDSEDFPKYDIVTLDEQQDANTLQKELALRYIKKSGRFVVVGDSRQCIYGFQGSSLEVFKSLQSYPNTIVLPLDITYRCGKNIVEEARKVFNNGIVAAPNAIDGIVRKGEFDEAENGDFILCRNNLPLATVFLYLLEMGKKATIKGKEYGDALVALVDKIKHIEDLDTMCEKKISELKERGLTDIQAKNNPSYVAFLEKCTILKILYKNWGDMKKLEDNIKEIYKDDTEGIVLSTIHKSKGLEADRVFFLNRSLIPSKYANTEEALYNEKCLLFVAITRARKELVYCNV